MFALAVGGCTTTTINAEGKNVTVPSMRIAVNLDEVSTSAAPHTGHAIEFGHARAKGHGDQTLATGQNPILYGNQTYNPPQQLRNEFDFNYTDISWRWRKFFGERVMGLELSAGVAHTSLDLSVSSAAQRATGNFATNGVQGGVGFVWRIAPATSLHVRAAGFASSNAPGVSNLGRYELFLSQALGDNLALRAGYAKWEMTGKSGELTSRFRVSYSGPTVELGLHF
jgi:hypothetical protein